MRLGGMSFLSSSYFTCLSTETHSPPTPPRTRASTHLPTPETGRRMSKRVAVSQPSSSAHTLPTPETLPRKRKAPSSPHPIQEESSKEASDPSPTGHTTFFLSQSSSSRHDATSRRRPGLTFAQQMAAASASAPATSRHGAGVGMRGARSGGHQVDKISSSRPVVIVDEDSPFVIPGSAAAATLASPGRVTRHRPGMVSGDKQADTGASPRTRSSLAEPLRSPPMIIADPVHSAASLLSPPPTRRVNRIKTTPPPPSPGTAARKATEARRRKMMDEDENPFLVKPGQKAVHRPRPVVDETRETVTYVFRGAKKVFANPFIPHNVPIPGSDLPAEDVDFEPHPCPPPRLLWPTEPEAANASTPRRKRRAMEPLTAPGAVSDEDVSPPSSPVPMVTPGGPSHHSTKYHSDDEFLPEDDERDNDIGVRKGLLFGSGATIRPRDSQSTRPRTQL